MKIEDGRYWELPWTLVSSWGMRFIGLYQVTVIEGQIQIHPDRLDIPLKRKKPTVYSIWNDIYHEKVPDSFRNKAYSYMDECHWHTFLVLTKRPTIAEYIKRVDMFWNLPNIYHGLTVCNQAEADEKIPIFLQVPGKKFLSIEPCLSAINIERYLRCPVCCYSREDQNIHFDHHLCKGGQIPEINIILGGETLGNRPGREMKLEWALSVAGQCKAAGAPLFVKQLHINGKVSKDMNEWPKELQRRELPWLR